VRQSRKRLRIFRTPFANIWPPLPIGRATPWFGKWKFPSSLVPRLPGVPHLRAVKALQKAGFEIARDGAKHIVMSKDDTVITIPRHDPVNAFTMAGIVRDAGLTIEAFRKLL
jgi:predicted RNA binding protein YcfA (HicA-like mRNA interferase family)